MIRRLAALALGFATVLPISISAATQTALPSAAFFQGRYAAMKAAVAAHDDAALRAILAPGFQSIDVTGKTIDADQMIDELHAVKPDPNRTSTTTVLSVTASGADAIVQQRYDMKTTKSGLGGKHAIEMIANLTDTWTLVNGAWLLAKTQTDSYDYYLDGHSVMHRTRS